MFEDSNVLPMDECKICQNFLGKYRHNSDGNLENGRERREKEIGFDTITGSRLGNFALWQAVHPTVAYVVCKTFLSPSTTLFTAVYDFLLLQLSSLLFSIPPYLTSSPRYIPGASPIDFLLCLLKRQPLPWVRMSFVVFLAFSSVSASMGVASLCGSDVFGTIGLAGFVAGCNYGSHHKRRRWRSDFSNVELTKHFSLHLISELKLIFKAAVKVSKLSRSALLFVLLPIFIIVSKGTLAMGELTGFYCPCLMLFICWEMNHHLLQVIITKRFVFLPPIVTTNPINYLLQPLESSITITHVRKLAYLDLCMVSESNVVDKWRRDAIFENTGETYKRVIVVCVTPLEQLLWDLNKFNQLIELPLRPHDPFKDMQVCIWCARIATALTVHSRKLGVDVVDRSWNSITITISTLLVALLVVETFMNINLQSTNQDPTSSTTIATKAYSMADVLRNSMYQIVSVFHESMVAHSRHGQLQSFLISSGHPLYESRELLLQKLQMFLNFQAH